MKSIFVLVDKFTQKLKTTRTNMLLDYEHNECEVLKVLIMHANIIAVDFNT